MPPYNYIDFYPFSISLRPLLLIYVSPSQKNSKYMKVTIDTQLIRLSIAKKWKLSGDVNLSQPITQTGMHQYWNTLVATY